MARTPPKEEARLMTHQAKRHSDLTLVPMLLHESLYIGIDVGKYQHVAGFVSSTLLERYERFEGCPVLAFEQSRQGFRSLIDRIRSYVPASAGLCITDRKSVV